LLIVVGGDRERQKMGSGKLRLLRVYCFNWTQSSRSLSGSFTLRR